ncbi:hypothetical protein [Amycolatopsis sp. YIM 10]|uniref:hypothetical protein n=1 Tax=Amycolatopsis sp. YIM 10 TaxID=2653857 RepID=UPI0012902876|nr:hypothetical protein [Amycolatopsis sp. YIM 10]QFU88018.1 hypothetical protein YIM_14160 [Amycolatopsis sp. YIM 10]
MSRTRAGWPALLAASAAAGAVAGLAGPFVVLMGQVLAGELGWVDRDSTLTDDGFGVPIGFGIVGLLFIVTAVAAVTPLVRRAPRRLPAAVATGALVAAVVAWLFIGR